MNNTRIGLAAFLITTVSMAANALPEALLEPWLSPTGVTFPGWLPTTGTVGQTVAFYSLVVPIIEMVVPLGLAAAFGYWVAGRRDVFLAFEPVIASLVVGSVAGIVLGGIGIAIVSDWGGLTAFDVVLVVLAFVAQLVSVTFVVVPVIVTGAVVRTVWHGDLPTRLRGIRSPGEADHDSPK